jgi:peptide/nickel transport system substrate-binding protein
MQVLKHRGDRMKLRKSVVAVAAALMTMASACGGGGSEGADPADADTVGGSIVIAIGAEPTTLDPQARDDGAERAIGDNVYETLVSRTADGELEPGLAAAMPEQVDDTTWEVVLREGVEFHDGEAFGSDDVVASVERILDPKLNSEQLSFFETLKSAEAVDEHTVRITTTAPDPVLPSRLYWLKIVPAEASGTAEFADSPVGTGPYRFVEWKRGDSVKIEANPDYWGEAPSISSVTYRFIEEPSTRLSALLNGEIDLVTNLLPEDASRAPNAVQVEGLEHPVMILNTVDGPTADPKVRRALNLAVDKESIAEDLFGGFGEIDQCQILSPSWTGFNEGLEAYPYDPDEAARLLEEAGVTDQTITLVGTSGRWLKDRELVEAVAHYWTEAGLKTNVEIYEFSEYLDRLFDAGHRPDAIFVTSSNELLDADRTLTGEYHMDGVEASNDDAALAKLIDDARAETDADVREDLYHRATEVACDGAYFLFLLNIEDSYGLSDRLDWEPRVDAKLLVKDMSIRS